MIVIGATVVWQVRKAIPETAAMKEVDDLAKLSAIVECDHPEYDMYK